MAQHLERSSIFPSASEFFLIFQTFISPFLCGILLGSILYVMFGDVYGIYVFVLFIILGFISGILFTIYIWNKYGTSKFNTKDF